ncbi:hypothetical protein BHM03_00038713 [Ensete ventricosum]|nr:hypothetical protein BHM03_00038713 [Ensete ventricosum]
MRTTRYRAVLPKMTIDNRLREKKGRRRRGKEEKRRGEKGTKEIPSAILAHAPSPPAGRPRAVAALARFFSRTRRRSVSLRGEKD